MALRCGAIALLFGTLLALAAPNASAAPPRAEPRDSFPPTDLCRFLGWRNFLAERALPVLPKPEATGPALFSMAWLQDDPLDDIPVSPESRLLERGHRNPWMASLASLVLPGAGQFYASAAPYAFTLQGFRLWMYAQGGAHVAIAAMAVLQQFVGARVVFAGGGGVYELTERSAQAWRIVYLVNAVLASASAFIEARVINRAGRKYVMGTRMGVWFDPSEKAAGIQVQLRF